MSGITKHALGGRVLLPFRLTDEERQLGRRKGVVDPVMDEITHVPGADLVFSKKADADKQIVWGVVYAPDVPDTHNDFMTASEIETMAYKYAEDGDLKAIDVMHDNRAYGCFVVESFIVRKGDPDFPIPGSWVVAVKIPDPELWALVKDGTLNGFSMEVLAVRKEAELVIEAPGVAFGRTFKSGSDDHEHEFEVYYDEDGKLIGGRTSIHTDADGTSHLHVIKRGTATEKSGDHSHRFAFIEKMVGA